MLAPVRTKIANILRSAWHSILDALSLRHNTSNSNENKSTANGPPSSAPNGKETLAPENGPLSENGDINEKTKTKKNEKQPQRRGGQRWRKELPKPDTSNKGRPSLLLRPKLICRENPSSRSWDIILSAYQECPLEKVYLEDENPETAPEVDPEKYPILSLRGNLIVECGDEYKTTVPLFDESKPLIFKLRRNWKGTGQRVSRITRGYFILIAPNDWERKGDAPAEQNNCMDKDFKVHFLNTTSGENFGSLGKWEIPSPGQVINLKGEKVFDNSEEGDLFIHNVPDLDKGKLSEVIWARIGEEKRNGWKGDNFKPHEELIPEVLGKRKEIGHFFLRVYDKNIDMIDSIEFRYLDELSQIRINDEEYEEDMLLTPSPSGYPLTKIHFIGIGGRTIPPQLLNNSICKVTSSDILEIPPNKKVDVINCVLKSSGGKVKITLKLQQIWWCIKKPDNTKFNEWHSTPFCMTQEEFLQRAKRKERIHFLPETLKSIPIGFGNENELVRQHCKDGISLNSFASHDEIANKLEIATCLNIMWDERVLTIIRLHPDQPKPEKTPAAQRKKKSSTPKPDYRILPRVKCSQHGWRDGKGFSAGEVFGAGFTLEEAKNQIPLDRRRTTHPDNIKTVQKVLDAR